MAQETDFAVTYQGPALETGRIPVRDLAPALLSLGELFAETSVLLHPDRPPVALDIRAAQEGSFEVHLIVTTAGKAWDDLVQLFGSPDVSAVVNLKELLLGGAGLFWFIRRMRGRTIEAQEAAPEAGMVRLTLDDGTTLEVPAEVYALSRSVRVRQNVRTVVEPLTREGVERVEFRSEKEVLVSVDKSDFDAFTVPEAEEVGLVDHESEMAVSIASVAFTEGNKWRLSDGANTFFAAIEDEAFLERVDKGIEAFRKGDILRCRVRIVQSQSEAGLHTEYHVLEVIEHIPSTVQLLLETDQSSLELGSPPPELGPGEDEAV